MLFHDIQKLRQIDDASLRRLAMGQVVEQVMRAWYQARAEAFPGMVASVHDLLRREPALVQVLDAAITHAGTDELLRAAEVAAGPAGGVFRIGDVVAVSWNRPAVDPVPSLFQPFLQKIADQRP